ncbi:MAG: malic enzyme-like NAD(P)-binding protein [Pseudomonadota bacterium]
MFKNWFNRQARELAQSAARYGDKFRARASLDADARRVLDEAALAYHRAEPPGKMENVPTKAMVTPYDLSLAYSPGVAEPCRAIAADPAASAVYTNRANTVAVISNGTAVLGLGDIGALAAKPVMEGKAALFRKFAGLNAVDLCIDEKDPERLARAIIALEPTFGGVNLEDICAPACFEVETRCRGAMRIPVFHDDQHGTAVCVLAAVTNALALAGKELKGAKIVTSGAGAAAMACIDLLVAAGAQMKNITLTDRDGVIYKGRKEGMDPRKIRYAKASKARTLADIIPDTDVFLGLSVGGVLSPEMAGSMAQRPIIFALANPDPEIWPEDARAAAPDAIIATGRTDYPNQVNNVLCFPFLFRGALDCRAWTVTDGMKVAASKAIARLAGQPTPDLVRGLYPDESLSFGTDYILPKAFDPRLLPEVAVAVARAAEDDGVADKPISDYSAYRHDLEAISSAAS